MVWIASGNVNGGRIPAKRFAGARRADHQHVVPARRRHFERPLCRGLAAHFGEIGNRGIVHEAIGRAGRHRLEPVWFVQVLDHLSQMPHPEHTYAFGDRSFSGVIGWHEQVRNALAARANRDRQRAAHRSKSTIERQFAHQQHVPVGLAHCPHRTQDPQRHRQVEARAFLANIRRREVDGDGLVRIAEARIEQRRFYALAALANRGVRHAYRDEIAGAAAGVHVHFDIDEMRLDPEDSGAAGPEQGHIREWNA